MSIWFKDGETPILGGEVARLEAEVDRLTTDLDAAIRELRELREVKEWAEAEVAGLEALVERLRGLLADASEVIERTPGCVGQRVIERIEVELKGDAPCQKSESE